MVKKSSKYQRRLADRRKLAGKVGSHAFRLNSKGKRIPAPLPCLRAELQLKSEQE